MGLNIDIVEQLVPNPMTMLVQLCSALVLFLLMKKFLWKSVRRFLDQRAEKMQADLAATEDAKKAAFADREKAMGQLNEASKRSEEIVGAAVRQAKDEKNAILAQASAEADSIRRRAEEQIEAERSEMYASMQKEIVDVAFAAAGKLVGDRNGAEVDRRAVETFVKEESGNDQ